MAYTEEQLKEAAKKAAAAGDMKSAEELARAAMAMRGEPQKERLRAVGQGLTLGFGDEIMAGIRAISPNQTYDAALEDERTRLSRYREANPISAVGYEMAGAAIPGLLAAPVTGGASVPMTLGRAAGIGAAAGGLYGFGTGEGGAGNRLTNAATNTAIGAVAGPAGTLAGRALTKPFERVIDFARRTVGGKASSAVEAEIQRLAAESGLSVDDVVTRVANGEMMAEMSDTLRYATRALKASSGEASGIVANAFNGRAANMRGEAMGALQGTLAPQYSDNVLRGFTADQLTAKGTEKLAYSGAFSSAGPLTPEIVAQLQGIVQRDPTAAKEAARLIRLQTGQNPYFSVDDAGTVTFTREPTLQEAELVRRSLSDATSAAYTARQGGIGEALGDMESGLRSELDTFSTGLKDARSQAATRLSARDAFNAGRTALSRPADAIMMEFDQITEEGARRAYQAGLMDNLRKIAQSPGGASLMGQLSDPNKGRGIILNYVMDSAQRDEVMAIINRAAQSQTSSNTIMGGSPTAQTLLQAERQGVAGGVVDGVSALRGDPMAMLRLADRIAKEVMQNLNEKQRIEVARLLTTVDPRVLERALKDDGGIASLQATISALAQRVQSGAPTAGAVGGGTLNAPPQR